MPHAMHSRVRAALAPPVRGRPASKRHPWEASPSCCPCAGACCPAVTPVPGPCILSILRSSLRRHWKSGLPTGHAQGCAGPEHAAAYELQGHRQAGKQHA